MTYEDDQHVLTEKLDKCCTTFIIICFASCIIMTLVILGLGGAPF